MISIQSPTKETLTKGTTKGDSITDAIGVGRISLPVRGEDSKRLQFTMVPFVSSVSTVLC